MCRHIGYLGPAVRVSDLLTEGENSLLRQSYEPRDMRGGGVANADGYGAAWWQPDRPLRRYRTTRPLWADPSGLEALASIEAPAVVAAVRNATVGMPIVETACAPFLDGQWAFSHNGAVTGWPDSLTAAASELPVKQLMTLEAPTDSVVLWKLLRNRLTDDATAEQCAAALAGLTLMTRQCAPGSRLNFLLSNGEFIVASTCVHSLSVRVRHDSVLVASEPLTDDGEWQEIRDSRIVVARPGDVSISRIEEWKAA